MYNSDDVLSNERVASLFNLAVDTPNALARLENETIEYKQSLSLDPQILRTCAAFANCRGGFIVFGVIDRTREPVELNKKHIEVLEQFDLKDIHSQLNDLFVPRIRVDIRSYKFQGKTFGVLFVFECTDKPVMAIKQKSNIRDRDIYYSYGGSIEKIRYAELLAIIQQRVQQQLGWLASQVQFLAKRGPGNVAQFDLLTGEGFGEAVREFAIDEDTLSELRVIEEGKFSEIEGAPAIKLMADVSTIVSQKIIQEDHDIDKDRLVYAFLDQEAVPNPETFLSAMTKHDVTYAPLYYFAHLADFSLDDLREFIGSVENRRKDTVSRLLDRLEREKYSEQCIVPLTYKINRNSPIYTQLLDKEQIKIDVDTHKPVMAAIRSLEAGEIDKVFILDVTRKLYQLITTMESPYRTDVRKLVCYLDRSLHPLKD